MNEEATMILVDSAGMDGCRPQRLITSSTTTKNESSKVQHTPISWSHRWSEPNQQLTSINELIDTIKSPKSLGIRQINGSLPTSESTKEKRSYRWSMRMIRQRFHATGSTANGCIGEGNVRHQASSSCIHASTLASPVNCCANCMCRQELGDDK
jgi:hypothetical protein